MSDPHAALPARPSNLPAPQPAHSTLVEPAEWLLGDEAHAPGQAVPLTDAEAAVVDGRPVETLADLAPSLGGANGVHTLRAILLGGPGTDLAARLSAIEERLDWLDARPRDATAVDAAQLSALERRLDRLAEALDDTRDIARASDVTLNSLATLQQQIEDLRRTQLHLAAEIAERAREADERCRLRQRQIRTTSRLELQRLRRLSMRDRATRGTRGWPAGGIRAGEFDRAAAGPSALMARPLDADPHAGLPGWELRDGQWRADGEADDEADDEADGEADELMDPRELDTGTAWRAVRRSTALLLHALAAWIVLLAHLAADDMRAAAHQIGDLFRR